MTAPSMDVVCFSRRVIDGWTNVPTGWMYGEHIIGENAPAQCPVCGLKFSDATTIR